MMTGIRMRLSILPLMFLLTGVLPVQACSPPADGSEFTCPPHDGIVLRKNTEEKEEPRYINDWNNGKVVLVDTREDKPLVIMETYHHMIDAMRNWKNEKERIPVDSSIDQALENFEWLEEE